MINVRLITYEDKTEILKWRNDPLSRNMLINTNFVKTKQHDAWFSSTILNKDKYLFMCLDSNKKKIGTVRFDIKDKIAKIAIILNPTKRNLGLSEPCIIQALKKLYSLNPEINFFIAEIRKNNIASKKLFEKIGFKLQYSKNEIYYYNMKFFE